MSRGSKITLLVGLVGLGAVWAIVGARLGLTEEERPFVGTWHGKTSDGLEFESTFRANATVTADGEGRRTWSVRDAKLYFGFNDGSLWDRIRHRVLGDVIEEMAHRVDHVSERRIRFTSANGEQIELIRAE